MPTKKAATNVVADVNIHHEGVILFAGQRQIERDLPADVVQSLLDTGGAHVEKET